MNDKPLCFVLMPFGRKPDPGGGNQIDFDLVYETAIEPGVRDAGMEPIRADEEELGGIIHKTMYERLLLCDFAVADLTTANANVLYELGVRHAARPRTTLAVHAARKPVPFDVRLLRTERYDLAEDNSFPAESAARLRGRIRDRLQALSRLAGDDAADSPLFQLITDWAPEPLGLAAASSFRAQLRAAEEVKSRLTAIRELDVSANEADRQRAATSLAGLREEVLGASVSDFGTLTGLFLAYRALADWTGMIEVYEVLPEVLRRQARVRQQLAFAHNRRAEATGDRADRARALDILEKLQREQGRTSETSGLIGSIHKREWREAADAGDFERARGHLRRAVAAYVAGFEADWRDIYPGINAVTLLDVQGGRAATAQKQRLLPVVRFAVEQRLRREDADYWDHATLLEVRVLEKDDDGAVDALDAALSAITERWQLTSTADNLRIIEQARRARGEEVVLLNHLISSLHSTAGGAATPAAGDATDQ
jgi:hypothetical protein